MLVVWSESLDRIVPLCNDIDERLIKLLWRSRPSLGAQQGSAPASLHTSGVASATGSVDHSSAEALGGGRVGKMGSVNGLRQMNISSSNGSIVKGLYGELGREFDEEEDVLAVVDEKKGRMGVSAHDAIQLGQQQHEPSRRRQKAYKRTWYGKKVLVQNDPFALEFGSLRVDGTYEPSSYNTDEELGLNLNKRRPVRLYAPLYSGLAAGLAVMFVGNGVRTLLIEWRLDGGFVRFALLGALPLLCCVSLVSFGVLSWDL